MNTNERFTSDDAANPNDTSSHWASDSRRSPATAQLKGRIFVITAAILWSLSGIVIKSPVIQSIPAAEQAMLLACYRTLFAALGLLPFVKWSRVRITPRFAPVVISFALMNLLFINAFTRTSAGATSFLQYTSTVWVFLFGWLFWKERIRTGNLFALGSAAVGIAVILFGERDALRADANLLALGSGVAYAGVILSLRCLQDEDATWITVLNHAVSGLVVLPIVLRYDLQLTPWQWLLFAFLGLFQMGLPYVLAARGVALLNMQEAALLMLLEPILIPTWAWLFWGETVGIPTLIGGGLILGGLALRYLIWPERTRNN